MNQQQLALTLINHQTEVQPMRITKIVLMTALAASIAACGGGGGGSGGSSSGSGTDTPPPSGGGAGSGTGGVTTPPSGGGTTTPAPAPFVISGASWNQVVGQSVENENASLAAGKQALIRVDLTTTGTAAMPTNATFALLMRDGGSKSFTLVPQAASVPTSVDPKTLAKSLTVKIPAADITVDVIGYRLNVPGAQGATEKIGDITVQPSITDRVLYRAVSFDGQTGTLPALSTLKKLVTRAYPQADVVSLRANESWVPETLTNAVNQYNASGGTDTSLYMGQSGGVHQFTSNAFLQLYLELNQYCSQIEVPLPLATAPKCLSAIPSNVSFGGTVGLGGGQSLLTLSFSNPEISGVTSPYQSGWLTLEATTFIHEYGHVLSLSHANGCGAPDPDTTNHYADGTIGVNGSGYDEEKNFYFAGNEFADFMSYCGKPWTADLAYRKVLNYYADAASGGSMGAYGPKARMDNTQAGKEMIALSYFGGRWHAAYSPRLPILVDSEQYADASFISPLLNGVKVQTYNMHHGQSKFGPFYIPATDAVVKALPLTLVNDLLKKN